MLQGRLPVYKASFCEEASVDTGPARFSREMNRTIPIFVPRRTSLHPVTRKINVRSDNEREQWQQNISLARTPLVLLKRAHVVLRRPSQSASCSTKNAIGMAEQEKDRMSCAPREWRRWDNGQTTSGGRGYSRILYRNNDYRSMLIHFFSEDLQTMIYIYIYAVLSCLCCLITFFFALS